MPTMPILVFAAALAAADPPSGRPPIGPLERYDPRIYNVFMEVSLRTYVPPSAPPRSTLRINYNLAGAEIAMPVIMEGTFSAVDRDSVAAGMWLNGHEDTSLPERARLEDAQPFNAYRVILPIERLQSDRFRWRVSYRTQVWSSRINDDKAAEIDWPSEWPEEVRDGLRPQLFIESNDPIFIETVERVSEGNLRNVPPYYAAKDLVRYVLQNVQIEEGGELRGAVGVLTGMTMSGAKRAATTGRGTPHDLVCVCIAMLRAANIPARPVVGMHRRGPRQTHHFVSWGEFYLPGAGWVPFDPVAMRGKGLHRHVREPWPEFGTMKDLNTRVPLSYHFTAPGLRSAPEYPAIWGWNPRMADSGALPESRQEIQLSMAYQGRGKPDSE